jgi:hypothetical protein
MFLKAMAKTSRRSQAPTSPDSGSSDAQTVASSSPASSSDVSHYDRSRVAVRAYEIYMQRGGAGGSEMDDWLAAEREFSNGDSALYDH